MAANVAVVLAGGVGTRVGLDIPKQLIKIAGRTILEHTIAQFDDHPDVDEIIVMMTPGHLDAVREIVRSGSYSKVDTILEGADTRNGTTLRAIAAIKDPDSKVLFHDAVRPLIAPRVISECFAALDDYDAVDVAIPSADTIVEVGEANTIEAIPPRARLMRGQTPQGFRARTIAAAYDVAGKDPHFEATDDCSVVLKYLPDVPIWIVRGEERNMKVTEPIDVYIADKLFQLAGHTATRVRTDAEYTEILKDRTMVVFGGSYGIGADVAELARSYGAQVFSFSRSDTGTHVERRSDIEAALKTVLTQTDRIDFVVNTAGVLPMGDLADTSEETIFSATEVNYLAPIFISQVFLPHLVASRGSLLLFTSSSYTRGRRGYSLYSSAKAAVVNLTQALADEWAGLGVRVNCINPERTGTPMRTKAFGEEPPESLLESQDVARASLDTLVSAATGHIIDLRRLDPLANHISAADAGEEV